MTHVSSQTRPIIAVTPAFAVAPQISGAELALLAKQGYRAVVSLRPDAEVEPDNDTAKIARLARKRGLEFRHVPAASHEVMLEATIDRFAAAVADLDGPVLAYCKSGQRAAIVWALAAARHAPVPCVLDTLKAAGLDLDVIEDELAEQPRSDAPRPALLAVECRQA